MLMTTPKFQEQEPAYLAAVERLDTLVKRTQSGDPREYTLLLGNYAQCLVDENDRSLKPTVESHLYELNVRAQQCGIQPLSAKDAHLLLLHALKEGQNVSARCYKDVAEQLEPRQRAAVASYLSSPDTPMRNAVQSFPEAVVQELEGHYVSHHRAKGHERRFKGEFEKGKYHFRIPATQPSARGTILQLQTMRPASKRRTS